MADSLLEDLPYDVDRLWTIAHRRSVGRCAVRHQRVFRRVFRGIRLKKPKKEKKVDTQTVNSDLATSPDAFYVAPLTAQNLVGLRAGQPCCRAIELLSAGTLQITNPAGVVRTYTALPAKLYPLQAQAIGAATTAAVLVYF